MMLPIHDKNRLCHARKALTNSATSVVISVVASFAMAFLALSMADKALLFMSLESRVSLELAV